MASTRTVRVTHSRARTARLRDRWSPRRIGAAILAGTVFALAVGIPTGVLPSPMYTRMTPVQWWNYPVWAIGAVLGGLVAATYIRRPGDQTPRSGAGAASGGGLLAAFAVGCPVCNKLVVAALGVSGTMTIWAPIQPALGVASILGLGWALRRRSTNEFTCSLGGKLWSSVRSTPERADPPAAGHLQPANEDADVGAAAAWCGRTFRCLPSTSDSVERASAPRP